MKTAVVAPLAAALPTLPEVEWTYNCQNQIWSDYLKYDYNLFIMPPATGKTYMADYIRGWWEKRQVDIPDEELIDNDLEENHRGTYYLCGEKVMRFDDDRGLIHIPKLTVFATLSGSEEAIEGYHRIAMSGMFNDRRFPIEELEDDMPMPIFHQSKPENYMREYECKFFPKKVRIIA